LKGPTVSQLRMHRLGSVILGVAGDCNTALKPSVSRGMTGTGHSKDGCPRLSVSALYALHSGTYLCFSELFEHRTQPDPASSNPLSV